MSITFIQLFRELRSQGKRPPQNLERQVPPGRYIPAPAYLGEDQLEPGTGQNGFLKVIITNCWRLNVD